ncbi:putative ABC transport system permease protein [Catalinimonas alkaloidigena]|uniref:ABC transporter permease n=1 Tax=Catalinimonas alkaloidigena TaxID=1075417 RepID=UPI002405421F|nr:ABC transporter permease [Catalinimonas alkaloidigena]MDF9797104.1 putative ABC transport system permease protein [Catalinimonas alkaloidigena]
MLRNFLTTTLRNLKRNKFNTLINISGLALSIACCVFIYAFVKHEYSFDAFHTNSERIYRIVEDYKGAEGISHQGYTTFPLARALRNDFPEIKRVTQIFNQLNVVVKIPEENGDKRMFEEDDLAYADQYYLTTFNYKLLAGQKEGLLSTPDEVVLTRALADKYFGYTERGDYQELIGKTIMVEKEPYQISAILEDIPRNTNVTFRVLLPFVAFEKIFPDWYSSWNNTSSGSYTFVRLEEGYSKERLEQQLVGFVKKYFDEETAARKTYRLQALAEIHTDELYGGTTYATPSVLIIAFVSMGIIVLVTACINFINLATAQSVKRAKEIGIRKALGSLKIQLVVQYMMETLLLTVTASLIGLYLAEEFVQAFNDYLSVVIDFGLKIENSVVYFLIGLSLLITFLAGYYPAHVLAGFRPAEALKQSINAKNTGFAGRFSLRKSLVVVQFVISQVLIFGTIVVATQMNYVHERDLGFRKNDLNIIFIPESDAQKIESFKNQLTSQSIVDKVSFSSGPPLSGSTSWTSIYNPQLGDAEKYGIERKSTDPNYLSTFNISLVAGRNLRESDLVTLDDSLKTYNVLLNEKAVKTLGFPLIEAAVGHTVKTDGEREAVIAGVVEDFFNAPLQQEIHPCLLYYSNDRIETVAISLHEPKAAHELTFVQDAWELLFPDHFYTAVSLDDYFEMNAFYVIEDVMYQSFKIFVFLSIFIGCLGLFGLVSYLALQRQKEIGIRKTMGATIDHIIYLFSKEFSMLVLLAFLVAAPLSYYTMQAWLETFEYRIPLSAWFFIITFILSMLIAWFTVGYKSFTAARRNPVDSLRNEG